MNTETKDVHICPRCNYTTTVKNSMIRHLTKKKPCPATYSSMTCEETLKTYEKQYVNTCVTCVWCNKKFNHRSNLYAHRKICKSKDDSQSQMLVPVAPTNNNDPDDVDGIGYIYILILDYHVESGESVYKIGRGKDVIRRYSDYPKDTRLLFTEVVNNYKTVESEILTILRNDNKVKNKTTFGTEYFECDYLYLKHVVQSVTNKNPWKGIFCNKNSSNESFKNHINDYRTPNLDYITDDLYTTCINNHDIETFVKNIYFNNERPFNHSIKIKNISSKLVYCLIDNVWVMEQASFVIPKIIQLVIDNLLEYGNANANLVDFDKLDYILKLQDDKKLQKEITRRLFIVIANGIK